MRSFFQALSDQKVRYLLISGQATVLYGAATFSEDVDLWVEPTPRNWSRLIAALGRAAARVYKLTPPLQLEFVLRGHGFHFTVSDQNSPGGTGYVDILGVPPRVGPFPAAWNRARWFRTDWGRIPVVAPADLVLLKKTRRLADYGVISALVRITTPRSRSRPQWDWALNQTYEADDLLAFWRRGRPLWRRQIVSARPAVAILRAGRRAADLRPRVVHSLLEELEAACEADRLYWRPILAELRQLQRQRRLLREGEPVAAASWVRKVGAKSP